MSIRELNGSDVKITGYVIPLDIKERSYVLSAYPYSSLILIGNNPSRVQIFLVSLKYSENEVSERDFHDILTGSSLINEDIWRAKSTTIKCLRVGQRTVQRYSL